MKIVDRKTFLKMPEGTFYSKGKPMAFESINVKHETLEPEGKYCGDWYYLDLADIVSHDTGEMFDRMSEMLENGASYPMNDAVQRDGCFDEREVFLVFERDDLERLAAMIAKAIEVSE